MYQFPLSKVIPENINFSGAVMTNHLFKLITCTLLLISISALANQQTSKDLLAYSVVDINHASLEQFTSLKGIGKTKAQAIIDYRDSHHGFRKIEELTNVKGIGNKILKDNLSRLLINTAQETLSSQPHLVQEMKPCITPNQ